MSNQGKSKKSQTSKSEEVTPEMKELLNEIENDPQLKEGEEEGGETSSNKPVKKGSSVARREKRKSGSDAEEERNHARERAARKKKSKDNQVQHTKAKPGKYITFRLAGENYGLYILSVKEIIGMMQITRVPRTPDFVRGVINLRGKVHPVIDLRKRFGLEPKEDDERTPIIIVEVHQDDSMQHIGIVVDAVSEVLNIEAEDLEDTPTFGVDLDTDFILGLAKVEKKVITLLDIDKILTSRQLVMMQDMKE